MGTLFTRMFRWSLADDVGSERWGLKEEGEAVGRDVEGLAREACRGFPIINFINK